MTKSFVAALSAIVAVASLATAQANPKVYSPQFDNEANQSGDDIPQVQVWLNDGAFRYGDVIRPHVQTEPGAYLTVVRVTTDGQLRVLYPRRPDYQVRYKEGQFASDRLPDPVDRAGFVNEGTGNGFVFAIASYYRFNYSYYSNGSWWSIRRVADAGRYGNPFEIVRRFVEEIMDGSDSYSMDYVMYNVIGDRYRSRYANRYRGYGFNNYLDLCLNSFGYNYYSYCRGYGYGYGYGYPVIVNNPVPRNPRDPSTPHGKSMPIKPLTVDPMLPHGPKDLPTTEGRFPLSNPSEDAAVARRERMLRDARPNYDPGGPVMRSAPRSEPRMSEPRMSAPPIMRSEPRMTPPPSPRSEPRIEVKRMESPPPQRERPQKDNQ